MTTIHHRGQTWERDERTIYDIDADLRDLADSTVERIAGWLDRASMGSLQFESWHPDQRRAQRAVNELARREFEAERNAQKQADEARIQARQDAANNAAIEAYRRQARAAWIGDNKSFEAVWPRLLQDWQIEQVRAATTVDVEARRRHYALEF